MPKISNEPLVRMQIRIYEKDKARLEALFSNNIGVNEAVRKFIRLALNQAEAQIRGLVDSELGTEDL